MVSEKKEPIKLAKAASRLVKILSNAMIPDQHVGNDFGEYRLVSLPDVVENSKLLKIYGS